MSLFGSSTPSWIVAVPVFIQLKTRWNSRSMRSAAVKRARAARESVDRHAEVHAASSSSQTVPLEPVADVIAVGADSDGDGSGVDDVEVGDTQVETAVLAPFRKYLVSRWAAGTLTDKELCEIAFYGQASGAKGVEDLAVAPTARGYNHRRRIRDALKLDVSKELHIVENVPMWDPASHKRVLGKVHMRLPLNALDAAFKKAPHKFDNSKLDPDARNVPSIKEHPVVKQYGLANVMPVRYYAGRVPGL